MWVGAGRTVRFCLAAGQVWLSTSLTRGPLCTARSCRQRPSRLIHCTPVSPLVLPITPSPQITRGCFSPLVLVGVTPAYTSEGATDQRRALTVPTTPLQSVVNPIYFNHRVYAIPDRLLTICVTWPLKMNVFGGEELRTGPPPFSYVSPLPSRCSTTCKK